MLWRGDVKQKSFWGEEGKRGKEKRGERRRGEEEKGGGREIGGAEGKEGRERKQERGEREETREGKQTKWVTTHEKGRNVNFVRNPRATGMRQLAEYDLNSWWTPGVREKANWKSGLPQENWYQEAILRKPQLLKAMIYTYRHKERWSSRAEYSRSPEREI